MAEVDTWFASAERADPFLLLEQTKLVDSAPLLRDMLELVPDLLLLLNEHRQVVFANSVLLAAFGVDPLDAVGMRPGELLGCRVAETAPNGCGTGRECGNCSATAVILAGLKGRRSEREARFELADGSEFDARVRAHPIDWGGQPFVGISLTDIRAEVRRRKLSRILEGIGEIVAAPPDSEDDRLVQRMLKVLRSDEEDLLEVHGALVEFAPIELGVVCDAVVERTTAELREHRLTLQVVCARDLVAHTSEGLLADALTQLVTLAGLRASFGSTIRLEVSAATGPTWFEVSWPDYIALHDQVRIFAPPGVAGEYSLGAVRDVVEGVLGGVVSLISNPEVGTRLRLVLPPESS